MAIISVRMNKEEEKIMNYLSSFFDEGEAAIIKRSLLEMYEDILDKKVIDQFEKEEHTFVTADDIMKEFI